MIVSVLVEVNVNKINKTFDYNVPDLLKDSIEVGKRVLVPFGKNNIEGFILEIKNNSEVKNSFNGRYDPLLDTNDKIIHELAAELEQSANKLDRIKLPDNRVTPTIEGTSHTLFPKKKQANVLTEDDNPK
jgi:primosomal protein N'